MSDETKVMDDFSELSNQFTASIEENKKRYNDKWNALSKDDQLDYFCAVIEKLHEGDVVQKRSYRGVLYDIFGWGPESYMVAQCAGYLDIHNMIYDANDLEKILMKFAIEYCEQEDNEDLKNKLNKFWYKRYA